MSPVWKSYKQVQKANQRAECPSGAYVAVAVQPQPVGSLMFTERGQGLIRWGTVLLLLSVFSGFVIPLVSDPILGLAAHIQGLLNAFMIILVGLIWSRMEIGEMGSVIVYWGLIIPGYVTLTVMVICTFLEIGGTAFPIVGGGHTGTPFQERVINIIMDTLVGITTIMIVLVTRAVLKKPAI